MAAAVVAWLSAAWQEPPPPPSGHEPAAILFSARVSAWRGDLDGFLEGDTGSADGTDLSVDEDLGLGREDLKRGATPELTMLLALENYDIRGWLTLGRIEASDDFIVGEDMTFEGLVYSAGNPAEVDLRIDYVVLGGEHSFVTQETPEDRAYGFLTLQGGFEGFVGRTEIRSGATRASASTYGIFLWFGVETGYRVGPSSVTLFGRLGPLAEFGAEARLDFGRVVIGGGWRFTRFTGRDFEGGNVERFQVDVSGPFLSVELQY